MRMADSRLEKRKSYRCRHVDTPPHECGRCSGYARPSGPAAQRPSGPRERLNALPERTVLSATCQDRAGSIVVGMQAGSALWACMPAHGHACVDQHTAVRPRTGLAGARRRHGDDGLASCCRCARPDGQKRPPPGIADTRGEVLVLEQVGRLQVFMGDGVALTDQRQCRLVVEVQSSPTHLRVRLGERRAV
jgi:hypothetical protein